MIRSMTAYSRGEVRGDWGTLTWEVRSINHRYLEPVFRMPEAFRDIEPKLRDQLREFVQRGKLECQLRFQPESRTSSGLQVNISLASELNDAVHKVNRLLDNPAHISAFEFLNWPGVLITNEADQTPVKKQAIELFKEALRELRETRLREGERILPMLTDRLTQISAIVGKVRAALPHIISRQNEALRNRFAELRIEVDANRFEQEIVILAQKADVAEELDRLDAHVQEVREVLDKKDAVGRRLDFLMQELNREANTLSSKSLVTETTKFAVELKVLIEQMREQIQNIE